jgi:hypothetical protein
MQAGLCKGYGGRTLVKRAVALVRIIDAFLNLPGSKIN